MRHLLRVLLNAGSFAVPALIGLAMLVPVSLAQSTVPLRYKWQEGQVLRHRITTETATETSGLPGSKKSSRKNAMVIRMTVQSVAADGTATIASVLESSDSNADKNTEEAESRKARDASRAMTDAMLNEQFVMVIRSDGSIKQVKGFERVRDIMNRELANLPAEMKQSFENYFSEDAVKDMLGLYAGTFPSHEVKFGESWTHSAAMGLPLVGSVSNRMTMTYKGMIDVAGAQVAKVDIAARISHEPAPRGQFSGLTEDTSIAIQNGTGSGEIWFDPQRGQLIKQVTRDAMSLNLAMGKDMKMTMRIESVRTLELIEDSAVPAATATEKK